VAPPSAILTAVGVLWAASIGTLYRYQLRSEPMPITKSEPSATLAGQSGGERLR
jgi:hypothetical protein